MNDFSAADFFHRVIGYRTARFQIYYRAQTARRILTEISNLGQVKSSRGATRPRSEHPDPNVFLPPPLRGLWRGLDGVGRYVGGTSAWRPATVTGPSAGS